LNSNALIHLLPIAAYLAATISLALAELRDGRHDRTTGLILAALGVALHAGALWFSMQTQGDLDVNFINMVSLAALLITATLVSTAAATRTTETCIIALPGSAAAVALEWLVPIAPLALGDLTVTARLHIVSSLLAYSVLSIAALNALVLAAQEYALRRPKMIQRLDFLPPLAVIESILFKLILAGWMLLTLSLASGFMFVDNLFAQHLVHKSALSLLSWILFGLLLLGRWRLGWRGRRAVRWTLIAMTVLALAYFGSKLVLEIVLDRSWQTPAGR
jgi:ABC-type uncharacterized transport system permease subunit